MRVKVNFGAWDPRDRMVLRLTGVSSIAHVAALVLFSVVPRFIGQPVLPMHATIAEIIPASALGPPPGAPRVPPGPSPSERAAAAREARHGEEKPLPPKREPRPPTKRPSVARDTATPPLRSATEAKNTVESKPAQEEEVITTPRSPVEIPPENTASDGGVSFGVGGATLLGGIPSIGSSAFPYDYYRSILVTLLQSHWRRPVTPDGLTETLSCRVGFTILKTGVVLNPDIVEGSGHPELDQSALRAVLESSPLPPLPYQYGPGSVSAEVVFELTPE